MSRWRIASGPSKAELLSRDGDLRAPAEVGGKSQTTIARETRIVE